MKIGKIDSILEFLIESIFWNTFRMIIAKMTISRLLMRKNLYYNSVEDLLVFLEDSDDSVNWELQRKTQGLGILAGTIDMSQHAVYKNYSLKFRISEREKNSEAFKIFEFYIYQKGREIFNDMFELFEKDNVKSVSEHSWVTPMLVTRLVDFFKNLAIRFEINSNDRKEIIHESQQEIKPDFV